MLDPRLVLRLAVSLGPRHHPGPVKGSRSPFTSTHITVSRLGQCTQDVSANDPRSNLSLTVRPHYYPPDNIRPKQAFLDVVGVGSCRATRHFDGPGLTVFLPRYFCLGVNREANVGASPTMHAVM